MGFSLKILLRERRERNWGLQSRSQKGLGAGLLTKNPNLSTFKLFQDKGTVLLSCACACNLRKIALTFCGKVYLLFAEIMIRFQQILQINK